MMVMPIAAFSVTYRFLSLSWASSQGFRSECERAFHLFAMSRAMFLSCVVLSWMFVACEKECENLKQFSHAFFSIAFFSRSVAALRNSPSLTSIGSLLSTKLFCRITVSLISAA